MSGDIKGKIRVSGSYLIFEDKNGKDLCFVGSDYLVDLETAVKVSRHLREIQSSEVREVVLGKVLPRDEDNKILSGR